MISSKSSLSVPAPVTTLVHPERKLLCTHKQHVTPPPLHPRGGFKSPVHPGCLQMMPPPLLWPPHSPHTSSPCLLCKSRKKKLSGSFMAGDGDGGGTRPPEGLTTPTAIPHRRLGGQQLKDGWIDGRRPPLCPSQSCRGSASVFCSRF